MSVAYVCRHCGARMGEIHWREMDERKLGFHFLTPEERSDIITYSANGDVTVKVTCEYCHQALQANPELTLVHSPLQ